MTLNISYKVPGKVPIYIEQDYIFTTETYYFMTIHDKNSQMNS